MSYSKRIRDYLKVTKTANTHTGKLIGFSELLKSTFGVDSYEIVQNVEQYIKSGGLMVLKGRMDMRLGQTIIEFKMDLTKELDTVKEEIERYTAILRRNGQKVAECIVTDGVEFKVFKVREIANIIVYLDGNQTAYSITTLDDSWLLTFNYVHSAHQVALDFDINIIPEFASFLILPLLMIATLLTVIVYKRKYVIASKCEELIRIS